VLRWLQLRRSDKRSRPWDCRQGTSVPWAGSTREAEKSQVPPLVLICAGTAEPQAAPQASRLRRRIAGRSSSSREAARSGQQQLHEVAGHRAVGVVTRRLVPLPMSFPPAAIEVGNRTRFRFRGQCIARCSCPIISPVRSSGRRGA